jgi:hypothetical protein
MNQHNCPKHGWEPCAMGGKSKAHGCGQAALTGPWLMREVEITLA